MSNSFKTEQELFWTGEFGDSYVDRNRGKHLEAANLALFGEILGNTERIKSVIEFGANIGLNLNAIGALLPNVELSAIEINDRAVETLRKGKQIKVYHTSILDFTSDYERDLAFTKGVLIHINPEYLPNVYEQLYRSSRRYICIAEYYNPSPVSIPYRDHDDRLFKRDFAGEMLEKYNDLRLINYGFKYRRDPVFPQDDTTWFLLEKTNNT
ncbi:MAG: pseudaminic acid biosynthesis-associated methylase [uncultured bacterium]|nr:MAG: pseudaminic acid biosynthesis-associated methylase [uncultured bacterium]